MDFTPGSILQNWADELDERVRATEARFARETSGLSHARWRGEEGFPHEVMTRYACGADWVVAIRPDKTIRPNLAPRPTDLIMNTGPVLLAPR